jgi:signal transduction histidine kinase
VILCGFAGIVGVLTTRQVRGQFNDEMRSAIDQLVPQVRPKYDAKTGLTDCNTQLALSVYARAEHAQIRVFNDNGIPVCSSTHLAHNSKTEPATQPPFTLPTRAISQQFGYRVEMREIHYPPLGEAFLAYARPLSDVDHTLARVRVFLILGVLGGTILALLAGLAMAQRAMRPVAELTDAGREIERTRDPRRRLPRPEADDEVAELARTLEGMLQALDAARNETQSALDRQREFVADASHELRTPLTSVLANLELLAEELDGEQADTAQAALRSTRRMRRLVGDLLLLARADAKRGLPHGPVDLAEVLIEAAGELEPVAGDHELSVSPSPAVVQGARDELHRLILNLIENALLHTPPGTRIHASTRTSDGQVVLVVEDDGPGIPPEIARRVFERFVRGGGDGGRGSGLGLAIVQAVVESHGGKVSLDERPGPGAQFVISLPAALEDGAQDAGAEPDPEIAQAQATGKADNPGQTSTTTGRTIGRRRSRS